LAAGPIFATVTINNVQLFEFVGPHRAGVVLGVSFVLHQVAAAVGPGRDPNFPVKLPAEQGVK
jgi:hypothetical protein